MSYTSESVLPRSAKLAQLEELITLLGYRKGEDGLKVPDRSRARIYLMSRKLEGPIAQEKSSGLEFMDELNPRILSNNFLLPYVVALWEDYFRSTFAAALKYSRQRESALKRARLATAIWSKWLSARTPLSVPLRRASRFSALPLSLRIFVCSIRNSISERHFESPIDDARSPCLTQLNSLLRIGMYSSTRVE